MKFVLFLIFLISAIFLPWWCTVLIGIGVTTQPYGPAVAVLGGIVMDVSFGAPLGALFGLQYLYTTLFVLVALCMVLLEGRVLD